MATNYVQDGTTFQWTATAAKSAGAVIIRGSYVGVALSAATGSGDVITVALDGVWSLTKPTGTAFAQGAPVYITSAGVLNTTATGDELVGLCHQAATSGAGLTTVRVNLKGAGASVADV